MHELEPLRKRQQDNFGCFSVVFVLLLITAFILCLIYDL